MGLKPRVRPASSTWALAVRDKLVGLRAADPMCQVHGASHHRYRVASPLAVAAVEQFERRERVQLPASYRRFVCEVGDGGAGPGYGMYSLAEARAGAGWIDGLKDLARVPIRDDGFRRHLLLAHHGCGAFSLLTLSGAGRGWVWGGPDDPHLDARDFAGWYEGWLDRALADSADRARRRADTVRGLEAQRVRDGESAELMSALADALDVPATRDRALQCRARAHMLAPQDGRVARRLARALGGLGRHAEAIAVCRTSLALASDDRARAELLHLVGLSFALQRQVAEASAALDRARALAPTLRMGQAEAVTAFYAGHPAEALAALRSAPVDAWSLHLRGLCHAALGDLDRAESYFLQCIERRTPPAAVAAAAASLASVRRNRAATSDGTGG